MKIWINRTFFVMLCVTTACQPASEEADDAGPPPEPTPQAVEAVTIWDGASVRETPDRQDGRWLSSLALGERVTWTGEAFVDTADGDREYYRVRMSDGREGWSLAYVLVPEAEPAVLTDRTFLYRRPDLLTVTDVALERMDMVAIAQEEGEWLEVVGNRREKAGWIKNEGITRAAEDVAVATLTFKALADEDADGRRAKLQDILENTALSGSAFMQDVRDLVTPDMTDAPDSLVRRIP